MRVTAHALLNFVYRRSEIDQRFMAERLELESEFRRKMQDLTGRYKVEVDVLYESVHAQIGAAGDVEVDEELEMGTDEQGNEGENVE